MSEDSSDKEKVQKIIADRLEMTKKLTTDQLVRLAISSMVSFDSGIQEISKELTGKAKNMTNHYEKVRERIRETLQRETRRLQFDPNRIISTYNDELGRIRSSLDDANVKLEEREAFAISYFNKYITMGSLKFGGKSRGDI